MADLDIPRLSQMLATRLTGANLDVQHWALQWLSCVAAGVAPWTTTAEVAPDGALVLELETAVDGGFATRSRIPCSFVLQKRVRIMPTVVEGGAVELGFEGVLALPLEGVEEVRKKLQPLWEAAGADGSDERLRARIAWEYWNKHLDDFSHTKLWRCIVSLFGFATTRAAIPGWQAEDTLLGFLYCPRNVVRKLIFFSAHNAQSKDIPVQVHSVLEPDVTGKSPKEVADLQREHMTVMSLSEKNLTGAQRSLSIKLMKSAANYAFMLFGREVPALGAADPKVICRLFTHARPSDLGGASRFNLHVQMNALSWQLEDETFQLSGDKVGRVVWKPISDSVDGAGLGSPPPSAPPSAPSSQPPEALPSTEQLNLPVKAFYLPPTSLEGPFPSPVRPNRSPQPIGSQAWKYFQGLFRRNASAPLP
jgi:hypothetical protein